LRRYNVDIIGEKFSSWKIFATYYTGHFLKVFKILSNKLSGKELFNDKEIERDDEKDQNKKLFASNIICFLRK
jgi:hypothetical protein